MNKLAENKYSYLSNFPLKKQNQLTLSETKRTKPPPPPKKIEADRTGMKK